jgi:hypothetical protein
VRCPNDLRGDLDLLRQVVGRQHYRWLYRSSNLGQVTLVFGQTMVD